MGHSPLTHYGTHIGKVKVHHSRYSYKVAYSLHALTQHIVSYPECFGKAYLAYRIQQPVVRYGYKSIYVCLKVGYAVYGIVHAHPSLKGEGLCDYANCKYAKLFCALRYNGGCAGAGAAAHACGYEYQIRSLESLGYGFLAFFSRLAPYFGISTRAQSFGDLFAYLYLLVRMGQVQRLFICIYGNELNAAYAVLYHTVDSVIARAAYADCARLPLSISSSRPIGISFPPDNLSYVTKQFSDLFDESALAYHSYQPVHAVFFLSMHHEIHYRKSAGVIWGGKSGHPRHSYL